MIRAVYLGMAARAREPIDLDVSGIRPDAVTVDLLARLQLAAGRGGRRLRLRGASGELLLLIAFMGLRDVLPKAT